MSLGTEKMWGKARDWMLGRQRSYQTLFPQNSPALKDLYRFCRAGQTCWHPDPRVHAVLEGRREVWLRIQQHLKLSPEQLLELFKAQLNDGASDG